MPYEVDFMNVGDGERSGDAIALRYRDDDGAWKVMIVDGGDKAAGERLVRHVQTVYRTNRVDYVVNTHPDTDHASGLEVVMETLQVGELWVHRPWNYAKRIHAWCADGRFTLSGLQERLQDDLRHAYQLEKIAIRKRIPIYEPFQGMNIGNKFWVASPAKEWYQHLLFHFDKTPETQAPELPNLASMGAFGNGRGMVDGLLPNNGLMGAFGNGGGMVDNVLRTNGLMGPFSNGGGMVDSVLRTNGLFALPNVPHDERPEWWQYETLEAGPTTSADNDSSVVLFGALDECILLTGDAGVEALNHAMNWLQQYNIYPWRDISLVQVPHHGSRHNVDPATLDRLLGRIVPEGHTRGIVAVASAGAKSDHPRRVVTNAFIRRGVSVYLAKGRMLRHFANMPPRQGVPLAQPVFFSGTVEG